VKAILALFPVQSAFPLLGKPELLQDLSEGYMAHKESNVYLQFVSLHCQQIFSSVGLGAFHQLFGPAAVLGSPPGSQVPCSS